MESWTQLYIAGSWQPAAGTEQLEVREAATGEVLGLVPSGNRVDVDRAVAAAASAFADWSQSPVGQRAELLRAIADAVETRKPELAELISREVGTPIATSHRVQVDLGVTIFRSMADLIEALPVQEQLGSSLILRQAVGVVAAITPWNYPLYQMAAKFAPALAAGCTTVVKPSSVAPLSTFVFADIVHSLGVPAGVFNVVTGRGAQIGEALASHPQVDMVSLTGSTGAGGRVAELAAPGIKRVALELGGKSAFVLGPGAELQPALTAAVRSCFSNNGQTCTANTRLLVPRDLLAEAEEFLAAKVGAMVVGDPLDTATDVGPIASAGQRDSIETYLAKAPDEGVVIAGGAGGVAGFDRGYWVQPTVVSRLDRKASLAQDEVFGPVMSVLSYTDVDDAVAIANDSEYGLSGSVWAGDNDQAIAIARRIRTGQLSINGGKFNALAPFGGFGKSGIGRELGQHGLDEYFELTALQLPQ